MTKTCRVRLRNGARLGILVGGILAAKGCCCLDLEPKSDDSGCGAGDYGWDGGYSGYGGGDVGRPDAYVPTDAPQNDSSACEQDAGPNGWAPYPWSCNCVLYTTDSPSAAMLPSPVVWEPCKVSTPESVVCEQMTRVDVRGPFDVGSGATASIDPTTGATLLQLVRRSIEFPVIHAVVVEADGAVRSSLLLEPSASCRIEAQALAEGRWLFRMIGGLTTTNSTGSDQGFVAGKVGDIGPSDSGRWPLTTPKPDRWFVSRGWIVRLGDTVSATSWGTVSPEWVSPWSDSKTWINALPVEGELLLELALGPERQLWTWNPKIGLRVLRGESGVLSASLLGTDGLHMAWAERGAASKPDGGKQLATLMRGWFTVDAEELSTQAEAVGEQVGAFKGAAYSVGCGMAARTIQRSSTTRGDLVVTRLDDGVAWLLDASAEGSPTLSWERVAGVTCEDVYVEAATDEGRELVRIRLDSLGNGVPPS